MTTKRLAAGADSPAATVASETWAASDAQISDSILSQHRTAVNRKDAARELLTTLWAGGPWAYWWAVAGREYTDPATGEAKRRKVSQWFPTGRPAPVPAAWRGLDTYFSVHPSIEARHSWQRSTIATIAAVGCLFAEYDCKDYGDKDAIMAHVDRLPRYPTALIDSGGGMHAYWLLSRPVAADDDNRRELVMLQRAWVDLVGGDPAAKDLARVLRVPGTFNHKYDPIRPVTLIEYRDLRRIDLSHARLLVGDHLAMLKAEDERRIEEDARRTSDVAPGAAQKLLQWAVANARAGARHNMALWLCGRLKDENIASWVALAVVEDFLRRVGDDPERDAKQAGAIVRHIYGGEGA